MSLRLRLRKPVAVMAGRLYRLRPGYFEDQASIARLELHAQVPVVMDWIKQAEVPPVSVSVVIATRDRIDLLRQAIASVLAQSHSTVELLVVDDGSSDGTRDLASRDFHVIRTPGLGLPQARNVGLAAATGEVVTYLDDDNRMHPEWARSLAWAFHAVPDLAMLYGARAVEDLVHAWGETPRKAADVRDYLPRLHLEPFSLDELKQWNYVDANAIAHVREHPEARFDPTTGGVCDWDLALRFAAVETPLVLPAIACYYRTREPSRMSRAQYESLEAGTERLRAAKS